MIIKSSLNHAYSDKIEVDEVGLAVDEVEQVTSGITYSNSNRLIFDLKEEFFSNEMNNYIPNWMKISVIDDQSSIIADLSCSELSIGIIICDATHLFTTGRKETFLYTVNQIYESRILKMKSKYDHSHLFVKLWSKSSVNSAHNGYCLSQIHLYFTMKKEQDLIIFPVHDDMELINSFVFIIETKVSLVQEMRRDIFQKDMEIGADLSQNGKWLQVYQRMTTKPQGLEAYECYAVQEQIGSIRQISLSDISSLRDCALDKSTATSIYEFFNSF